MSIYDQIAYARNDGVLGDGQGNVLPLTRYTKDQLIGITFFYGIQMGNPNTKSKKQLIKTIQANRDYQRRVRKEENNPRVSPALKRAADKIIKELSEVNREQKEQQQRERETVQDPDPIFEDQLDITDTIGDIIRQKANMSKNTDADWYANELASELSLQNSEVSVKDIKVGDFLFFGYTARYPERYPYYDRRPLAFILEKKDDKMIGANIHYLNPDYRGGVAESLLNKTNTYFPKKTLHSYLYTNVSGAYRIPDRPGEYDDVSTLITENFVEYRNGQNIPYDLNKVWDSPD